MTINSPSVQAVWLTVPPFWTRIANVYEWVQSRRSMPYRTFIVCLAVLKRERKVVTTGTAFGECALTEEKTINSEGERRNGSEHG